MKFSAIQTFLLYYNTLRHLKPAQILCRFYRPFCYTNCNVPKEPLLKSQVGKWVPPLPKPNSIKKGLNFKFNNVTLQIRKPIDWQKGEDLLWIYNLHYFDSLSSKPRIKTETYCYDYISAWLKDNAEKNGVGWAPYPLSLRIVNWIKWNLNGNELSTDAKISLFEQAIILNRKIEWHLFGNHLFENGKALIFAGAFFDEPKSKKLLTKGIKIVTNQIREQILDDGGHFELSTMYHAIVLEGVLDILNLTRVYPELFAAHPDLLSLLEITARKMSEWLITMTHPDGQIALFNDACLNVPKTAMILNYYKKLLGEIKFEPQRVHFLDSSGYLRVTAGQTTYFIDVAEVGASYIPGHAHADTLTFEASFQKQRVFVNSGTSTYKLGSQRHYERGTSSHNTVELNYTNSSQVWASFRVARRAHPYGLSIRQTKDGDVCIKCAHDGYKHSKDGPIHTREWKITEKKLTITDQISGPFITAIARFFLYPSLTTKRLVGSNDTFTICEKNSNKKVATMTISKAKTEIKKSFWYPKFGKKMENIHFQCGLKSENKSLANLRTTIAWHHENNISH